MILIKAYYLCSFIWAVALASLFIMKKIQPDKESDWYFFYALLICAVVTYLFPTFPGNCV